MSLAMRMSFLQELLLNHLRNDNAFPAPLKFAGQPLQITKVTISGVLFTDSSRNIANMVIPHKVSLVGFLTVSPM
jgi:hypothetical protein